jgi:hypothetical protein
MEVSIPPTCAACDIFPAQEGIIEVDIFSSWLLIAKSFAVYFNAG